MTSKQDREEILKGTEKCSGQLSAGVLSLGSIIFVCLLTFVAGCTRVSKDQVRQRKTGYTVPIFGSRDTLSIPESGLSHRRYSEGGSENRPRSYRFEDDADNLVILVRFKPARAYRGIESFWEKETRDRESSNLPEPLDVMFVEILSWNAVMYDQMSPGVYSSHIRAHQRNGGTWTDVHLSMTSDHEDVGMKSRLIRVLKRMRIETYSPKGRGYSPRITQISGRSKG